MGKQIVVYVYNGILLNGKNEWTIYICNNMGKSQNNDAKKEARQRVHII